MSYINPFPGEIGRAAGEEAAGEKAYNDLLKKAATKHPGSVICTSTKTNGWMRFNEVWLLLKGMEFVDETCKNVKTHEEIKSLHRLNRSKSKKTKQ